MPKTLDIPQPLRPYLSHGLVLEWERKEQAVGDCPFCGKEKHFFASPATGLWDCKVCGESGNTISFLRKLWERGTKDGLSELAASRKLLLTSTLEAWGVRRSPLTDEWLIPGYSVDGKLCQLYRYEKQLSGKYLLKATAGVQHALYYAPLLNAKAENLYICEGPWDGMIWWEALRQAKWSATGDGSLDLTSNYPMSLAADSNVIAVPGCNVFRDLWAQLGASKRVFLTYDSDHPRKNEHTGATSTPAGYTGMQRTAGILSTAGPREIHYLSWGPNGYDPDLPSGYDIRDHLGKGPDIESRIPLLQEILQKLRPVPDDWFKNEVKTGDAELALLPCNDWKTLVNAWMRAMDWIPGLDAAMACLLAVSVSTEMVGDQLWIKLISMPSSGKTTICEAISVARQYVFPTDTMTSLVSGYQVDKDGSENLSLVRRIKNKTVIINDGDTFMNLPNRDQILSHLRAFYGRNLRAQYANKMSANHEGISMTLVLSGTDDLAKISTGELGERFLDIRIVDEIDEESEDRIALRKAYQASIETLHRYDGTPESRDTTEMTKAKQLTGGYVQYLRENAFQLVAQIKMSEAALSRCVTLGTFVAYMRSQPGKKEKSAQRELSYRLVSQHVRLAKCLAIVLNKREVDDEVMERVKKVSLDTAKTDTFKIVKALSRDSAKGLSVGPITVLTNETEDEVRKLLRHLRRIKAVEVFVPPSAKGQKSSIKRWRLTERMCRIYNEVMG